MKRIAMDGWLTAGALDVCLVMGMGLNAGCSTLAHPSDAMPVASTATSSPAAEQLSARQAWHRLMAGNARFVEGRLEHPEQSVKRREQVARGQRPFAVVLACSDSRVPPEIVFDTGLGDVFVVRVAGNTADDAAIGSIEYAVEQLHVPLIVVLGHERCGAVQAAVATVETKERPEAHLGAIIDPIVPAVEAVEGQGGDVVEHAMKENVRRVVQQLKTSRPVLSEALHRQEVSIVGASYDLDTGKVSTVESASAVKASTEP